MTSWRFYAVTRRLEIISEASRRLPEDLKARHSSILWKEMAGAGNVYRHGYESVEAYDVVDYDPGPLAGLASRSRGRARRPRFVGSPLMVPTEKAARQRGIPRTEW